MTTYKLKRKLYSLDEFGNVITPQERLKQLKEATGKKSLGAMKTVNKKTGNVTFNKAAMGAINKQKENAFKENTAAVQQKMQTKAITKNPVVKQVNKKAYNAGVSKGLSQAGIKTGAMNTWNRMGTMGKIGTAAAGVAAAGLMAKGVSSLFNKKKDNQ